MENQIQNNISVFDFYPALEKTVKRNDVEFDSLEQIIKVYKEELKKSFEEFLRTLDQLKWAKDPFVSMFTSNCSESRIDISEGGCEYNNYGITTVGLANVTDSLFILNVLVYEQKRYSYKEIIAALDSNYANNEQLYIEVSKHKKFYGHDDKETISLVNEFTGVLADIAKDYRNKLGGIVKFGVSSPGYNLMGKRTGADVSGRKAGMPYNTHISCNDASYTELVNFASKLDYTNQRYNGNVIDFFIPGSFIKNNEEKFNLFMKLGIKQGFYQMQLNVMDSKTLIYAKKNPENYAGLIVRVWGFSSYFNDLPESYKDLLITRAIEAEKMYA